MHSVHYVDVSKMFLLFGVVCFALGVVSENVPPLESIEV